MDKIESDIKTLSVLDAVAIIVGIVIGAGIFKTPSLVATFAGNETAAILVWIAGGAISFIGAVCYAELTSAFPHSGGDYHYLSRAFGTPPAFLFAWSRMTVIQTGSIVLLAFLVGDYASEVVSLGAHTSSLYAVATVIILTGVNVAGIRQGTLIQKMLIGIIVLGMLCIAWAGISFSPLAENLSGGSPTTWAGLGSAMIFVLLTYGGWNEAAFLSSEVRGSSRTMVRVLFYSIGLITLIYVIINYIFIRSLGIAAMSGSEVVAADLMRRAFGEFGAGFISILIVITALSTMNGVIITGARTNYAFGRDISLFGFMGHWREKGSVPLNAYLLQGLISIVLVFVGTTTRSGFVMMVDYTAPVFWFFFFLSGVSLMVLRVKYPNMNRPFKVPLYPLTPILFCAVCLYMLQSSLAYTGKGAILGVCVVLSGVPLLFLKGSRHTNNKL